MVYTKLFIIQRWNDKYRACGVEVSSVVLCLAANLCMAASLSNLIRRFSTITSSLAALIETGLMWNLFCHSSMTRFSIGTVISLCILTNLPAITVIFSESRINLTNSSFAAFDLGNATTMPSVSHPSGRPISSVILSPVNIG